MLTVVYWSLIIFVAVVKLESALTKNAVSDETCGSKFHTKCRFKKMVRAQENEIFHFFVFWQNELNFRFVSIKRFCNISCIKSLLSEILLVFHHWIKKQWFNMRYKAKAVRGNIGCYHFIVNGLHLQRINNLRKLYFKKKI